MSPFTVDCLQVEEIDNFLNVIGGVFPGKIDQCLDEALLTAMTGGMFDQNGTVFQWNKDSYTIK
jgi:hypothetical protein